MRERLLSYLAKTSDEQFALLRKLVELPSHTADIDGVNRVGAAIAAELARCGLVPEVQPSAVAGDHLVFRTAACFREGSRPLLLVGHMDTVFPRESPFREYREDDARAYGPGVIDMKGGLVVAVHVLHALAHVGLLDQIPLVLVCNSDEETGSQDSQVLIAREAQGCLCGLVFECGGLQGEVVTGRKGKTSYRLLVHGQAGHAAFAKTGDKPSAILALAHLIIGLEALNAPEEGVSVNVGRIEGGIGPNTVAAEAWALVDTRVVGRHQAMALQASIDALVESGTVAGTCAAATVVARREPMEQSAGNRALFDLVAGAAHSLGLQVREEFRSGVSDANTIAACGRPVIDGLGPIGDLDHSDREYMVKSSLGQRCQLAALTVLDIWRHAAQGGRFG